MAYGFTVLLTPENLLYCFIGATMGTLVGVLPGLGPLATISILLPAIIYAPPVASIIMLAGVYYGAQYAGSITSILVNIPGEVTSVVTCLDGYPMAKQGRAGPALGIAAFGSFIAGTVGIVGLMLFAPSLAELALNFGPTEMFSLSVMALTLITYLSQGSMIKSLTMACVGIVVSTIGMDPINNQSRFTFGIMALSDGIELTYVAMGVFGLAEVLKNLGEPLDQELIASGKIKNLLPTRQDWKDSAKPIARGTIIGFVLGCLPGIGNTISTFASYIIEKRYSKHPEKFGNGAIEGVAGPESANNSSSTATFVPLLSLGIPANATTGVLLGALILTGFSPGPLLISSRPDLFWGLVASMYLGNAMLLVLNLPLIPIWVKVLKIPYSILSVIIIMLCVIGAYTVDNQWEGVALLALFSLVGYYIDRYKYPGPPLLLALLLGPMLEHTLRQSLMISDGSPMVFLRRPISAVFLAVALISLISPLFTRGKRLTDTAIIEKEV